MAALGASAIAACASINSTASAGALLRETFSANHKVSSGDLMLKLTVDPSGSRVLTGPISISFGGRFQSLGAGRLPRSDFSVRVSALGRTGSLGIISTGTSGYVTLQGASYRLPKATFRQLESSFAQLTSSPGGGSGAGTLAKLGIQPLHWLENPTIVGQENVGGAQTTHIRAGVNVSALLADLDTFLAKASSLGVSGADSLPNALSPSTRSKIAREAKNVTFDLWTGTSDKTIRKLAITLTLPVSGRISTELGGLRSADIGLTMEYSGLNQPQTITAPTSVRPYSEFTSKITQVLQGLEGVAGGASSSGSAAASTGSSGAASGGASAGYSLSTSWSSSSISSSASSSSSSDAPGT